MSKPITLDGYLQWHEALPPRKLRYIPESFDSTWPESLVRIKKVIATMTVEEKQAPNTISPARTEEIASKSGVPTKEVSDLISNFLAFRSEVEEIFERIDRMTILQRMKMLFGFIDVGPDKSPQNGNTIHARPPIHPR